MSGFHGWRISKYDYCSNTFVKSSSQKPAKIEDEWNFNIGNGFLLLTSTILFTHPDGEIENSVKSIFEIRIPNFCYIQVIVFDLGYLPVAAVET